MSGNSAKAILKAIKENRLISLFQPIVSVQKLEILGYEALVRGPSDKAWHSPQMLFSLAEKYDIGSKVEIASLYTHIRRHHKLGLKGKLFLNLSSKCLSSNEFEIAELVKEIAKTEITPDKVIIEITERHPVHDFVPMISILQALRHHGLKIAIDDLGAGYSSLRQWSEIRPDFVKIDGHFVENIHEDSIKRQFVRSICEIANNIGSSVIAEGIETEEELDTIRSLEVDYLQGYLVARPQRKPIRHIPNRLKQFSQNTPYLVNEQQVRALEKPALTVSPSLTVKDLSEAFYKDKSLRVAVVLENRKPLGIITRNSLQQLFSSHYGRDLYGRKPVTLIMNEEAITVNEETKIDRLSNQITTNNDSLPDEYFVIVDKKERYTGVGSLIDLLRSVTDFRITATRHANPLTLLPGNLRINQHIDSLLSAKESFVLAYCDVDNFKPFNDTYGYARGDDVIREIGQLLSRFSQQDQDFVGHIGGDDFIVVFRSIDWETRCRDLLDHFQQSAIRFYDDQHKKTLGITSIDRTGKQQFFDIISLSIGVVQVNYKHFTSHKEVASISSEVKKQAKRIQGNSLFIDRRNYENVFVAMDTGPEMLTNVVPINPKK
ncbi:MAG: bifunctional diguanylate cyclase/phosphodiesterase [Candidatus Thiodiazotropha sp.]